MTERVDVEGLRAKLDALRDEDLRSVHRCHSQPSDYRGAETGYVCGFDGESLDDSHDECHHTLPERIAEFCVAMREAAPSVLAEVAALRAENADLRGANDRLARGVDALRTRLASHERMHDASVGPIIQSAVEAMSMRPLVIHVDPAALAAQEPR